MTTEALITLVAFVMANSGVLLVYMVVGASSISTTK